MDIYFAPLQGFTDYVYRNAHAKIFSGVDKYFTPFLRIEKSEIRPKDQKDILLSDSFDNSTNELVPQIIANSREDIGNLVQFIVNQGFKAIDLNFGCPFPQQAKKFRGVGIWEKPEYVKRVLESLKDFIDIEFSLKMRIGNTNISQVVDLLDVINSAPLRFVTIHPRLGKQMYSGDIDLETFKLMSEKIIHPIVYNGDVNSLEDIQRISSEFPNLKAIMIGRGLLANPFLAEDFKKAIKKSDLNSESGIVDKRSRMLKFHSLLLSGYSEAYSNSEFMVLDKMKTFWTYSQEKVDKKILKSIQKSRNLSEYLTFSSVAISSQY